MKKEWGYKANDLFNARLSEWHLNACVGNNGGPYDYEDYMRGYFLAATKLADELKSDRIFSGKVDILVYPLVFLYRQAIELAVKGLLLLTGEVLKKPIEVKSSHTLSTNWALLVKKTVDNLGRLRARVELTEVINKISPIITDIDDFDFNSQTFRYPVDKKGTQHLAEANIINIGLLADSLDPLHEIFDLWFAHLNDLLEKMRELD